MWINLKLCISAGSKTSWKFCRDSLVDGASHWHGMQRREAFSVCFYQAFVTFFSIGNKEEGFFQAMLKTLGKKCLYLAWIVSQPFSDTSECDKQIIPYLSISSTDFITTLQIPQYNKYVRLYLKFKNY